MQDLSKYDRDYFTRDIAENWYDQHGLLRPDELAAIAYAFGIIYWGNEQYERRKPKIIYSIGCGRGVLEKKLEDMGCHVIGVDPSPGAKELYQGKHLIDQYEGGGDTIIFCESLEHIPRAEIDRIWGLIPVKARVIIVNWLAYHPLMRGENNWEHITQIDDNLFKQLSAHYKIIVQNKSHLVMERTQ